MKHEELVRRGLDHDNFRVGQKLICKKLEAEGSPIDFTEQHLTIGKEYEISDIDFHFPDSICIKKLDGGSTMFMRTELFMDDNDYKRLVLNKKLKKIKKF